MREQLVIGETMPVNVSNVDSSVSELHERVAGVADIPSARAVLFNVVACLQSEAGVDSAMRSAAEVVSLRPCRAIVIGPPRENEAASVADMSAVCGVTERGERRLCGEVIRAWAHPADLSSLVNPLLVEDAPLYAWFPERVPWGDGGFRMLLESADAAIVDSRGFSDAGGELSELLGLQACALKDLAWVSLLPWREMIAGHFDPPGLRRFLGTLSEVVISHSGPGVSCSALLLLGWLADRLGLSVSDSEATPDGLIVICRMDDRDVRIELRSDGVSSSAGDIDAVTITCGSESGEAVFRTTRVSATEIASEEVCSGICYPPRTMELPSDGVGWVVAEAVDQPLLDPRYEAALRVACRLVSCVWPAAD